MPTIKFLNTDEAFDVPKGTSILECALDNNYPLDHDCGGNMACTTCLCFVEEGMENLSPQASDEKALLEANGHDDPKARLGCQSRLQGGNVLVKTPE